MDVLLGGRVKATGLSTVLVILLNSQVGWGAYGSRITHWKSVKYI